MQASQSLIDDELTPVERKLLAAYCSPSRHLRRQIRRAVLYAVGVGLFVCLGIWSGQPDYGIVVYVAFLQWMALGLLSAWHIAGATPAIIGKYEARIAALQAELARVATQNGR
jgi:hypothetical protein